MDSSKTTRTLISTMIPDPSGVLAQLFLALVGTYLNTMYIKECIQIKHGLDIPIQRKIFVGCIHLKTFTYSIKF